MLPADEKRAVHRPRSADRRVRAVVPFSSRSRFDRWRSALRFVSGAATLLIVAAGQLPAAEPNPTGLDFFERKVRPLLAEHCTSCHGEEKQKGGLRLDSPAAIRAGGESGALLSTDRPDDSRLILAVSYRNEDLQMPPKQRLAPQEVATLTEWVRLGAPMPASTTATPPARKEFQVTDKDRAHWAFRPLRRPEIPKVGWRQPANPIDAFVLSKLKAKGLGANPPATRQELIRRATYDLIGLPPTPAEVEAFLADKSPQAWENLIDRLLASPHYGEKWGRHWLDLMRFAESNSYEHDQPKPHAWRFRDYVIRALNADKPYDGLIRELLAGDELPNPDDDAIIATGFYRLGIWDSDPPDRELARYDGLDDIVSTTGQVFLGLTVDCARCHHHKIDPISQGDYYRLLAFFQNVTPYQNGGAQVEIPLPQSPGAKSLGVSEGGTKAPATFVLLRGNPKVKGDAVEPGFPQVLISSELKVPAAAPGMKTSGRRTVLANWIASPDNPLTARVMANRIWQHHFGRGIVRSPNNFGLQGDAPTHPELLDWLAGELINEGWRLKPLHRIIMTSQAYQMSSQGRTDGLKKDPANDAFWRFDVRRLTAEEIRDSILAINGTLNPKMFGPSIYVEIPKEVLAGQSRPGQGWGKSSPEEQARRSIYIHAKRSLLTPILESFDVAETDRPTPVRFTTVQPTQALGMINSEFLNRQAELFAARLRREAGPDVRQQVRLGLHLATSREPTRVEVQRGMELIHSLQQQEQAAPELALKYFCLMVLNLNEVVYLN